MSSLIRSVNVGFITAVVVMTVVGVRVACAVEEKPLSPKTVVDKKVEGKATVEFEVGEVEWMLHGRKSMPGECEPLYVAPKATMIDGSQLYVYVSWQVVTQLKRLGIEDPAEHFQGKVVRISGTVERFKGGFGPIHLRKVLRDKGPEYRIEVSSLDQLEVIRKP